MTQRAQNGFRHAADIGQALAMIAVLGWGFWQGIVALMAPAPWDRIRQTLDTAALLDGRTAAAINHAVAQDLPAGPILGATGAVLRWAVFGAAGPQLRLGCDGWLFLTEEIRPWPQAAQHQAERIAALRRLQDRLAARDTALLVAVVPDKARIQSDSLCGIPVSVQAKARYAGLIQALEVAGIRHLGLRPALRRAASAGDTYYRTDTHWNQDGAARAALAIAAALGDPPGPDSFHTTTAAAASEVPGDLLRLMGLERVPDPLRPAPDREARESTEATRPSGGVPPAGGLLDDTPAADTVLLGSSYALNGNFHGRLQQALGRRIGNFAEAGGGFWRGAAHYFASAAFSETPPRLVIWEVPERSIGQPIEAAERAFLNGW